LSETRRAPAAVNSPRRCSGGGFERQFQCEAFVTDAHGGADARSEHPHDRFVHAGHDELPAARVERKHFAQAAGSSEPPVGQNRDATAERLRVAQHVRAEEHGAAAIA